MSSRDDFLREREELNRNMLSRADRVIKRFISLDSLAYQDGALTEPTKELLGLVASLVLRCDDCIAWHLTRCSQEGLTTEEIVETMGIGMVVGGSITIPHVRRGLRFWEDLKTEGKSRDER